MPADRVAVIIEGVRESVQMAAIARDVRRMFHHLVGRWRVNLRPAERGCWRLELTGAGGRHLWFFAAPANRLADIVVEKLEAFLNCPSAPLRPAAI